MVITMTDLQRQLLDILLEIDGICQKHGIEYYLVGGTLIGAIRHKGFIPWDDDADIIMTRDNWYKFHQVAKEELGDKYVLSSQDDNINYALPVNHISTVDTASIYRYNVMNHEPAGTTIDVLILDPVPDTPEDRYEYRKAVLSLSDLTNTAYAYSFRRGESSDFEKHLADAKERGLRAVADDIVKNAFHHKEEDSQLYAKRLGGSPHFWKKEYYGKPKYVPFEDTMLPVPERAGDCLCVGYDDDWMYIPRGGLEHSVHEFVVRGNRSSEEIYRDFDKHIDRNKMESLYNERKALWDNTAEARVKVTEENDIYYQLLIQMKYEKKLVGVDVFSLVDSRDYDKLHEIFDEYIDAQVTAHFLGSSSLSGWMNWYRKQYPYLIDIGDEALYAVCYLLLHEKRLGPVGKLVKARARIERELPDYLSGIFDIYRGIVSARSHYQCEEFEDCRAEIDKIIQWKDQIPFIYILDLYCRYAVNSEEKDIPGDLDAALNCYPGDDELLLLKAKLLLAASDKKGAYAAFEEILSFSNNGLVLLDMKGIVEGIIAGGDDSKETEDLYRTILLTSGYELDEHDDTDEPDEEDAGEWEEEIEMPAYDPQNLITLNEDTEIFVDEEIDEEDRIDPALEKRITLLNELHDICEKNNIDYFLCSSVLLQAMQGKRFKNPVSDINVMMKAKDINRFINAVNEEGRDDRYIDSYLTNKDYPTFNVRYCDANSIDFSTVRNPLSRFGGLFVTIFIVRKQNLISPIDKYNVMFENGWERQFYSRASKAKSKISQNVVTRLIDRHGEEAVAKKLFNRLTKSPVLKMPNKAYYKTFSNRRVFIPAEWLDRKAYVELEGRKYYTFFDVYEYLQKFYGKKWYKRNIKKGKISYTRILDPDTPFKDFYDYMDRQNLDKAGIWERRKEYQQSIMKLNSLTKATGYYWDFMAACGERYEIAEYYYPIKDKLEELYNRGDIEALSEEMNYYVSRANYYRKRKIGLYIDDDLLKYIMCIYEFNEQDNAAEKLKEYIESDNWEPVVL